MARIPYRYDPERRTYRVQPGFKFPGLVSPGNGSAESADLAKLRASAQHLLRDSERFLDSLREFCEILEN
jgi:hypothetical protein